MTPSNDDEERRGYEVGYGKTPPHTRFQPGKSGNPEGGRRRKPKSKAFSDLFREQLGKTVTATIGGRKTRITRFEALAHGLIRDALEGKERVRKQVVDLLIALEARGATTEQEAATAPEDLAILQAFLDRNQGKTLKPPSIKRRE